MNVLDHNVSYLFSHLFKIQKHFSGVVQVIFGFSPDIQGGPKM